ncbi:hypothetical protein ABZX75_17705 [Streptomyces sp. NPDC003038]|uniref:hypothetical protein n=1 Tax=unclassified Streptomyces TaxID=2593676 RepID=UPI0033ABD244
MTAAPGQRAVQRPLTAATATQRILGRAVTQNATAPVGPVGVAHLNGAYYDVDLSAEEPRLVPRGPLPVVPPHSERKKSHEHPTGR